MNTATLVIADPNAAFVKKAAGFVCRTADIQLAATCSSGAELIRLCHRHEPSAVLMDVVLEDIDGFCVLNALSERYPRTAFIVCTSFYNDLSIARAHRYGASCFLCKPCDSLSLCSAIRDCVSAVSGGCPEDPAAFDSRDSQLQEILSRMGVLPHYEGYELIRCAVKSILGDPSLLHSMTKHLYPKLAGMFGSTPSRVERNMRTAIRRSLGSGEGRLTNRELLKLIVERLTQPADII